MRNRWSCWRITTPSPGFQIVQLLLRCPDLADALFALFTPLQRAGEALDQKPVKRARSLLRPSAATMLYDQSYRIDIDTPTLLPS